MDKIREILTVLVPPILLVVWIVDNAFWNAGQFGPVKDPKAENPKKMTKVAGFLERMSHLEDKATSAHKLTKISLVPPHSKCSCQECAEWRAKEFNKIGIVQ